jgi:hypothetical protein
MWVGREFDGDDNKTLKDIQFKMYNPVKMARKCRDVYMRSCEILSLTDVLYQKISGLTEIDHRTLQTAHDQIAAFFRFSFRELYMPLIECNSEYRNMLTEKWQTFYENETSEIADVPKINQTVIQILAHQNQEIGTYAETVLSYHLNNRYGDNFREHCKQFRNFGSAALPKHKDWPYDL